MILIQDVMILEEKGKMLLVLDLTMLMKKEKNGARNATCTPASEEDIHTHIYRLKTIC